MSSIVSNENLKVLAIGAVQDRKAGRFDVPKESVPELLNELSKLEFDFTKSLVFCMDSAVVIILDEAPETHLNIPTGGDAKVALNLLDNLRSAGAEVAGIEPKPYRMLRTFFEDVTGQSVKGNWRKARVIAFQSVPPLVAFGLAKTMISNVAQAILAGLSLFVTVFTILGFDRLIQSSTTLPIKSLHRMYRDDRYVTTVAAAGLFCSIVAILFASMTAFESVELKGIQLGWIYSQCSKLFLALSILCLLVCITALITYYLVRVWSRIESQQMISEIRRWKQARNLDEKPK